MPTTSPVAGHGAPASLPLAPHIHHHHVKTTEERPQRLVLLGSLEPRPTHWIPGSATQRGHTEPCDGGPPHCEWCRPKIDKRVNFYAPALLAEELPGLTAWRRIVLCVPQRTMERHTGNVRGAVQFAWRKNHRVFLDFSTHCYQLDEPAFDVQPVLDLVWGREDASLAVFRLRESLTVEVIPPVIAKPTTLDEIAAIRAQMEELQRQIDEGNAERERLKAAGKWPGSQRLTGKTLDQYRDHFERTGGGEVHRNGTHPQPNPEDGTPAEGGAE